MSIKIKHPVLRGEEDFCNNIFRLIQNSQENKGSSLEFKDFYQHSGIVCRAEGFSSLAENSVVDFKLFQFPSDISIHSLKMNFPFNNTNIHALAISSEHNLPSIIFQEDVLQKIILQKMFFRKLEMVCPDAIPYPHCNGRGLSRAFFEYYHGDAPHILIYRENGTIEARETSEYISKGETLLSVDQNQPYKSVVLTPNASTPYAYIDNKDFLPSRTFGPVAILKNAGFVEEAKQFEKLRTNALITAYRKKN